MPYEWDDAAQEWVWVPDSPPPPPQQDPFQSTVDDYAQWHGTQDLPFTVTDQRGGGGGGSAYGWNAAVNAPDNSWRNELAGNDPTLRHGAWDIPNYYNMNQDDEARRGQSIWDTYKQNNYLPLGLGGGNKS